MLQHTYTVHVLGSAVQYITRTACIPQANSMKYAVEALRCNKKPCPEVLFQAELIARALNNSSEQKCSAIMRHPSPCLEGEAALRGTSDFVTMHKHSFLELCRPILPHQPAAKAGFCRRSQKEFLLHTCELSIRASIAEYEANKMKLRAKQRSGGRPRFAGAACTRCW
jgi:hypothetical protein